MRYKHDSRKSYEQSTGSVTVNVMLILMMMMWTIIPNINVSVDTEKAK